MKIGFKSIALSVMAVLVGSSLAYSAQCMGITKKGAQCKRQASAGVDYCWQHVGKPGNVVKSNTDSQKSKTIKAKKVLKIDNQCEAITKARTRCKRNAKSGSSYCWQHGG